MGAAEADWEQIVMDWHCFIVFQNDVRRMRVSRTGKDEQAAMGKGPGARFASWTRGKRR